MLAVSGRIRDTLMLRVDESKDEMMSRWFPLCVLVFAASHSMAVPLYDFETFSFGVGPTYAYGLNNRGEVVGSYKDHLGTHGFTYKDGVMTPIDAPGASYTSAYDINDDGTIGGYYSVGAGASGFLLNGTTFASVNHPNGGATNIYALGSGGEYGGAYVDDSSWQAFTSDGRSYSGLPSGSSSAVLGMSNNGLVVGEVVDHDGVHGFIHDGVNVNIFDVAGAQLTIINDININGLFVGSYVDGQGARHGYLADADGLLGTINIDGAVDIAIQGVNDAGDIVGFYSDGVATYGFKGTSVVVTEPSQTILLLFSLALLSVRGIKTSKMGKSYRQALEG